MDSLPTYDNLPWDMIVSALRGELSPDEELRFRQWLAVSGDNRQKYDQLQRVWKEVLADYLVYRDVDARKALEAFHRRIGDSHPAATQVEKGVPRMSIGRSQRWMAAAVLLLAVGTGWWYFARRPISILYETAFNEQKSISLPDGSTVVLNPQTRIRVAPGFNEAGRTVILAGGEAQFEVSHQERLPFVVDMDVASVKDLGTHFTVQRTKDSIRVTVSAGRIAFAQKETGESREVSAGSSLVFYVRENRFGNIRPEAAGIDSAHPLRFNNSSLSEVVAVLQQMSGKKISLGDPALGQKRLTIRLQGESLEDALKIICTSLELEYMEKNGEYIIKNRAATPHH